MKQVPKILPRELCCLLIVITAFQHTAGFCQTDSWQQKQSFAGPGRYLAVGFSIGTKGYIGTGFDGTNALKDFWEYDPQSDTWSQKADFGGGVRVSAAGFSIGTKGYIATGSSNNGPGSDKKDLWEYDPAANSWTKRADLPGVARQVATGLSIGNKGYIGLGRTEAFNYLQDFWEYDPSSDTWTRKTDFPPGPRYASVGFSICNKGYIGTGTSYPGYTYRSDFWEYDPSTDSWARKADYGGGPVELAVGFSIGNKGYIGTGLYSPDMWEYDPVSDGWTQKSSFTGGGRNMATGFSIGGKGYLGTGAVFWLQNDLWEYTPSSYTPCILYSYYADQDGDGYGNENESIRSPLSAPPPGYTENNTDCNDNNPAVHPGALEICNDQDDDCDGEVDEGVKSTFYLDADGDGYGSATSIEACSAPTGYVNNADDCNDGNASIHPTASGICGLAPQIVCPENIRVNNLPGQCGAIVNFSATESTGFPASTIAYSHTSGSFFPVGTTIVTATATNAVGVSTCTFTVTVNDVEPPVINCAGPVTINNNPGTCSGTVTLTPPVVSDNCTGNGNALSFAGGYAIVPNTAALNPLNEWTLETWVKRTRSGIQESLIEKYNEPGDTYGYVLRIQYSNKPIAAIIFGSYGSIYIEGTTSIMPGTWYHLAATLNRATGVLRLYVNGVLEGERTGMTGLPVIPNNTSLKLGARGDDAASPLGDGGLMDEIRIWNVERTQAQIQSSMNSELGPQAGLVALYHLNQGVAGGNNTGLTTVIDDSGNNLNGTLTGFALNGPLSNWVEGRLAGSLPVLTNNAPEAFPIGNTTVTWTAADPHGNTSTCTQVVTVVDNQPPAIICPAPVTITTSPGLCTGTTVLTPPAVSDNCNASFGNALNFAGGYAIVPNTAALNPLNEWTLETWVKRTRSGIQESLIEKYNEPGDTYGYVLRIQYSNKPIAAIIFGSYGSIYIEGTTSIMPGTWYHLAATLNRTTGVLRIYVNGVLEGERTGMTGLPVIPNNTSLKLGARGDDAASPLGDGGLMDEIRIWNVERTQAQIQSSMNSELGPQAGLVALYHLNQGVAGGNNTGLTTVIDDSGNNLNGILTGFALNGPLSNWVEGKSAGLTIANNAPAAFPVGNTIVTWTATDAAGNQSSCAQVVTVADNITPVIHVQNIVRCYADYNLGCNINLGATATDNCGILSFTSNAPACFPVGTTVVTWTAVDTHGNSSTAIQTVTRNPEIHIEICAGRTLRIYKGTVEGFGPFGPQSVPLSATVSGGTPGYTYSWSPAAGLSNASIPNPVASPSVTTTYTLTVTDTKGCTRTLPITVAVLPLSDIVCGGSGTNVKFSVCHSPAGNPSASLNLCVGAGGLATHLETGSAGHSNCYLGPCGQQLCFSTAGSTPGTNSITATTVKGSNALPAENADPLFRVNVFPNPSAHSFTLLAETSTPGEPIRLSVVNATGQVLESGKTIIPGKPVTIGERFRPGVYFIHVMQEKKNRTLRVIKLPE